MRKRPSEHRAKQWMFVFRKGYCLAILSFWWFSLSLSLSLSFFLSFFLFVFATARRAERTHVIATGLEPLEKQIMNFETFCANLCRQWSERSSVFGTAFPLMPLYVKANNACFVYMCNQGSYLVQGWCILRGCTYKIALYCKEKSASRVIDDKMTQIHAHCSCPVGCRIVLFLFLYDILFPCYTEHSEITQPYQYPRAKTASILEEFLEFWQPPKRNRWNGPRVSQQ